MSKNSLIDKKKILELKEIKRVVRRKRFVMKLNNEKKIKKKFPHMVKPVKCLENVLKECLACEKLESKKKKQTDFIFFLLFFIL